MTDSALLQKGQRIRTSLGTGVVLGFEVFNAKGWPLPIMDDDPCNGCRVVVRLDDPARWQPTEQTPHPYIFRSDIRPEA